MQSSLLALSLPVVQLSPNFVCVCVCVLFFSLFLSQALVVASFFLFQALFLLLSPLIQFQTGGRRPAQGGRLAAGPQRWEPRGLSERWHASRAFQCRLQGAKLSDIGSCPPCASGTPLRELNCGFVDLDHDCMEKHNLEASVLFEALQRDSYVEIT